MKTHILLEKASPRPSYRHPLGGTFPIYIFIHGFLFFFLTELTVVVEKMLGLW